MELKLKSETRPEADKVIVNFSGGKDSTVAILKVLEAYPKERVVLCFQDTGAEYLETEPIVEKVARLFELPLVILRNDRNFWDLVKRWHIFPAPHCRYCTQYLKFKPLFKWLKENKEMLGQRIILVSGIRGEESLSRSKLPEWDIPRETLDGLEIIKWYPCLQLKEQEVFEIIRAEGLPLNPCYKFSKRCSCWACIFQRKEAVRTYAEMHPDLYEQACSVEDMIKHKWRADIALSDLTKQMRLF